MWLKLCTKRESNSILAVDTLAHHVATTESRSVENRAKLVRNKGPTPPDNWFNFSYVMMPVQPSTSHWALVVLDMAAKKITIVDCFDRVSSPAVLAHWLNPVKRYLIDEAYIKGVTPASWKFDQTIGASSKLKAKRTTWWTVRQVRSKQRNSYDCGVYACLAAESFANEKSFDKFLSYSDSSMALQRARMLFSLLNETIY